MQIGFAPAEGFQTDECSCCQAGSWTTACGTSRHTDDRHLEPQELRRSSAGLWDQPTRSSWALLDDSGVGHKENPASSDASNLSAALWLSVVRNRWQSGSVAKARNLACRSLAVHLCLHSSRASATCSSCARTPQNRAVNQADTTWLMFDFRDPAAVKEWGAIDDRVMGGISSSRLRHDQSGYAVFEGTVSLERNGGFASVRSTPASRGWPAARTCFIEARAEGKRFKLSLLTSNTFDSVNYQATFAPSTIWQTVSIPLATFRATFRGREVVGAPPLDPAGICQVGLMIAERQAGTFALEVRRIGLA